MKAGILADIHGDVDNLRKAIHRLQNHVDQFVVLGDVIYHRQCAKETVAMLRDCRAVGVWGNHELGLCVDPSDELRAGYGEVVLDFFSELKSTWEAGEYLFSHTLPDQDAADPMSYYLGPRPDQPGALDNCFSQFPHRAFIIGHFHRWLAATPAGVLDWNGERPLTLEPDKRYVLVIHAVMNGWSAILDDEAGELSPVRLS